MNVSQKDFISSEEKKLKSKIFDFLFTRNS